MTKDADNGVIPFDAALLPKSLRILGKTYPVKVKKLPGGAWGMFYGPQQFIGMATSFSSMDEAVDTLLHEAIHAVEYNANLDYDEPRVRLMATGLLAIFRDNPALLKLVEGDYSGIRRTAPKGDRLGRAPSKA